MEAIIRKRTLDGKRYLYPVFYADADGRIQLFGPDVPFSYQLQAIVLGEDGGSWQIVEERARDRTCPDGMKRT